MMHPFSFPSHLSIFFLLLTFPHLAFPFLPLLLPHFLFTLLFFTLFLFPLLSLPFPLLTQLPFLFTLQFAFAFLLAGQTSPMLFFEFQSLVHARYCAHSEGGRCGTGHHSVHVRRHVWIHLRVGVMQGMGVSSMVWMVGGGSSKNWLETRIEEQLGWILQLTK